jgi:hypothetical protein
LPCLRSNLPYNMRYLILLIACAIAFPANSQQISGQVIDKETQKPIPNATIYFDGTFLAAITDSSGTFTLRSTMSENVPVIVSSIGYTSQKISDYPVNRPLLVELQPKIYELKEVVVTDDGMSRGQKLNIFKREFLGLSRSAKETLIENEDDIFLTFNSAKKTLEAFSDKPIAIHNKYLGYKILYYLDNFTVIPGATAFDGNAKFTESTISRSDKSRQLKRRRDAVFLSSRMYFIRALWNNELEKNGFKIYDIDGRRLKYEDIVIERDSQKYIKLPSIVKIGRGQNASYLSQKDAQTYSYIDSNGYYDASMLTWRGPLAGQRVGDLLPFEYQ